MRKVLYIFAEFKDQDIDWLVSAGSRQRIPVGTTLIEAGKHVSSLYFVLSGRFRVLAAGTSVLADLASGEILGELSFLDSRPPNATVSAVEDSTVLTISAARLSTKLKTDMGFAARFYRALGVLLAHRLRDTTGQLAYGPERHLDEDVEEDGEVAPDLLENMGLAAARFDRMLQEVMSG
ncbi:MAG: cyclic nucleotide-binding domain-containing protein [Gammaproteobacteria bacterium]|nr:cyclic nucleotide-binding domain-containing protein [Gammaproteobacteria bacterium]